MNHDDDENNTLHSLNHSKMNMKSWKMTISWIKTLKDNMLQHVETERANLMNDPNKSSYRKCYCCYDGICQLQTVWNEQVHDIISSCDDLQIKNRNHW